MVVVKKVKQLDEVKISALVLLAKADGKSRDTDIARWIIAASPHWRSQGYTRIIKEMSNG